MLAVGHVVAHAEHFPDPAVFVEDWLIGPGDPHALAVSAHVFIFIVGIGIGIVNDCIEQRGQVPTTGFRGGHNRADDMLADDFFLEEPKEPFRELVEKGHPAMGIQPDDDAVGALNQLTILCFAFLQGCFCPLSLFFFFQDLEGAQHVGGPQERQEHQQPDDHEPLSLKPLYDL